jgi:hypothetical protein
MAASGGFQQGAGGGSSIFHLFNRLFETYDDDCIPPLVMEKKPTFCTFYC